MEEYENILNKFKDESMEVVLFGAGQLGQIAIKVFEKLKINVIAVIDNNPKKANTCINGIPVVSQQYGIENFRDKHIVVCVFDDEKETVIIENLRKIGFLYFISKEIVIYAYVKKNIKESGFLFEDNKIKAIHVNLIITEHCSLKCRHCSHYIPYRENPVHWPARSCINWLNSALQTINVIEHLEICGGELLLHPDLYDILTDIAKLKNITYVEILTNGTIEPTTKIMELLKYSGKFSITVSDYGEFNYKAHKIKELCELYGVSFKFKLSDTMWAKNTIPKVNNRSLEENRALFITCQQPEICPVIVEGKLYRCVTSYINTRMNWIREEKNNYFNLISGSRQDFKAFILNTEPLPACDYCLPGKQDLVPRAEQITDGDFSIETLQRYLEK